MPCDLFLLGLDKMTERAAPDEGHKAPTLKELAESSGTHNVQPPSEIGDPTSAPGEEASATEDAESDKPKLQKAKSLVCAAHMYTVTVGCDSRIHQESASTNTAVISVS